MKKVILLGAGAHAAKLRWYIHYWNEETKREPIKVAGYLSDSRDKYDHYQFTEPFLGSFESHNVEKDVKYLLAFSSASGRRQVSAYFKNKGASFATFIHPTSLIAESAKIGEGTVISHNASVGPKAEIGSFNLINSRSTIGHDVIMGSYNQVGPQVVLTGHTKVGDENLIGTNACTIPNITIGNRNLIAAGMTVYKDVRDDQTVLFRHKERLVKQR